MKNKINKKKKETNQKIPKLSNIIKDADKKCIKKAVEKVKKMKTVMTDIEKDNPDLLSVDKYDIDDMENNNLFTEIEDALPTLKYTDDPTFDCKISDSDLSSHNTLTAKEMYDMMQKNTDINKKAPISKTGKFNIYGVDILLQSGKYNASINEQYINNIFIELGKYFSYILKSNISYKSLNYIQYNMQNLLNGLIDKKVLTDGFVIASSKNNVFNDKSQYKVIDVGFRLNNDLHLETFTILFYQNKDISVIYNFNNTYCPITRIIKNDIIVEKKSCISYQIESIHIESDNVYITFITEKIISYPLVSFITDINKDYVFCIN